MCPNAMHGILAFNFCPMYSEHGKYIHLKYNEPMKMKSHVSEIHVKLICINQGVSVLPKLQNFTVSQLPTAYIYSVKRYIVQHTENILVLVLPRRLFEQNQKKRVSRKNEATLTKSFRFSLVSRQCNGLILYPKLFWDNLFKLHLGLISNWEKMSS